MCEFVRSMKFYIQSIVCVHFGEVGHHKRSLLNTKVKTLYPLTMPGSQFSGPKKIYH